MMILFVSLPLMGYEGELQWNGFAHGLAARVI